MRGRAWRARGVGGGACCLHRPKGAGRAAEARGQGPDAVRSRSDAAGALDGESGPINLPGPPGKDQRRRRRLHRERGQARHGQVNHARREPRGTSGCRGFGLTSEAVEDTAEAPQVVTVLDRLTRAGLSRDRVQWWLDQGGVLVDGEVVTDPASQALPPARVVLRS